MNKELQNQLYTLVDFLKKDNNIYGICLVGSSVSSKEYSDIDILIIGKNCNKIIEHIVEKFKKYNTYFNDDSIRIHGYLTKELGIAIYNYSKLTNDISNYIKGNNIEPQYKNWTIVGWLPECLFYDLKNMIILYETDRKISRIKKMIDIYPQKLKKSILEACNEKIKSLLKRIEKAEKIEHQIIEAEIMSLNIRKKFAESEIYFRGFKNIDKQIKELSQSTVKVKNLFYGTWELDGVLKNVSPNESIQLLKYAKKNGINKFDTALAYGNGKVEKLLSQVLTSDDIILTKVPATIKPSIDSHDVQKYYPTGYISKKFKESLHNLNRDYIDIVLLHNWSLNWNDISPLIELSNLKQKGLIKYIGISLPNNFSKRIDAKILKIIDYIEAPYNIDNEWILQDINYYKEHNVQIILRSLFMQGMLARNNNEIVEKTIKKAKSLGTYLVIGMTNTQQIDENIRLIKQSL